MSEPKTAEVKLVPVEPTEAMIKAADATDYELRQQGFAGADVAVVWAVMLAASPPAETGEGEPERLMREFYLSAAYDPKAERPADVVKAAIGFALSAQPVSPSEGGRDYPAEFEAWWATYKHRNRLVADYPVKKQIAFDAFYHAARTHPASDQSDTERMRAEREDEIVANAMCLFRAFVGGSAARDVQNGTMTKAQADDWKVHAIRQHEESLREMAGIAALAEKAAGQ